MKQTVWSKRGAFGTMLCAVMLFAVLAFWKSEVTGQPPATSPDDQILERLKTVRADIRSLAVACEAYFVDNNVYPAWTTGTMSINALAGKSKLAAAMPSFRLNNVSDPGQRFMTLTTPISYISGYVSDLFTSPTWSTFAYWSVFPNQPAPGDAKVNGVGWILVSPGPDGDYDLLGEWEAYNPGIPQPSPAFLAGTNRKGQAYTYDPTNGIVSDGDIWRVKQ